MTVEHAVRAWLVADVGLAALVVDRIYQLKLPEAVRLPALRVQLIDEPRTYHARGHNTLTSARVQVDAYAVERSGVDPYAVATDVADAVDASLSGAKGDIGLRHIAAAFRVSRRVQYDADDLREVRIMQDFLVISVPIESEG